MATVMPQPFWAQEVEARIIKLRDRTPLVDESARDRIGELIAEAGGLTEGPGRLFTWRRLADWWYGSRVERAWSLLHQAELLIIDASKTELIPVLFEEAAENAAVLDQTDPARVRFTNFVGNPNFSVADIR